MGGPPVRPAAGGPAEGRACVRLRRARAPGPGSGRRRRGRRSPRPDRRVAWRNGRELAGSVRSDVNGCAEMLWRPLALAALNQPADGAAAPPFARVLAESRPRPRAAAIALPIQPLDLMYAEPARAFIEHQRRRGSNRPAARVRISERAIEAVEAAGAAGARMPSWRRCRGSRSAIRSVTASSPTTARRRTRPPIKTSRLTGRRPTIASRCEEPRRRCRRCWPPLSNAPAGCVLADRDRQSLVRSTGARRAVRRIAGRAMQWVFDKRQAFGGSASHCRSCRAAPTLREPAKRSAHRDGACRSLLEAMPGARRPAFRGTVVRERRATFSLAPGQPARPATVTDVRGLFLAGDWIDTGCPLRSKARSEAGTAPRRRCWG